MSSGRNLGLEFFIDEVLTSKGGETSVVGNVNVGGSVALGEVFRVAYVIPRTLEDVLMVRPLAAPICIRKVSLTLMSVEVMRQSICVLGQGISATVKFSGEGLDLLSGGDRLTTHEF